MKFNAATQDLLHRNPKALQFLHYAAGFDFTKPYYIAKGAGRFTYTQIKKQVFAQLKDCADVVLLVRRKDHWTDKLCYVPIENNRFMPVLKSGIQLWSYDMDDFYTNTQFEEIRKNSVDVYYVVAQAKFYHKLWHEKPFDYAARYEILRTYPGKSYNINYVACLDVIDKGTMRRYVSIRPENFLYPRELEHAGTNIHNYIDKSGYYAAHFRHELHKRLRTYKADNARRLVLQTDFTSMLQELDSKIKSTRKEVAGFAATAQTKDDYRDLERIADNVAYMIGLASSIRRRVDEKAYNSMDSVRSDLDIFDQYYTAATKMLRKEDEE